MAKAGLKLYKRVRGQCPMSASNPLLVESIGLFSPAETWITDT